MRLERARVQRGYPRLRLDVDPRDRVRSRKVIAVILAVVLLGGTAAAGAIATNRFGAGDLFARAIAKIERIIAGPPPDRPTLPTVSVTPKPVRSSANPMSPPASGEPTIEPTPTLPPKVKVDVDIVTDHDAVFSHELDKDWCVPAGIEMVLAITGNGAPTDARQRKIASRVREWESYADSHNGAWGPAAMALALEEYGAGGYEIRAYETRQDALRGASEAISMTNSPAVLFAWRGAHTWVMSGYRANADPVVFDDAVISGAHILDPWYPWVSSIWGRSDPPGTFQDSAEMNRNFLPWKRPEGKYPDRDGKFIVLIPTIPLG
ncbi:MAG TPA: hypothetical protein VM427_00425 [Patescibacteria group bacterium]|nr:hypothetical protein [Patescibacteria group bacterium]